MLAGQDADGPFAGGESCGILLTTFDFSLAKRYMRYWQHTALLYRGGRRAGAGGRHQRQRAFPVPAGRRRRPPAALPTTSGPAREDGRVEEEQFYYHETPQDIPENLFFALEGWIPYSDLMQVFDNELGLYLSADYYVAPISYRSYREYLRDRGEFLEVCKRRSA